MRKLYSRVSSKNLNGKIPLLELVDGRCISESKQVGGNKALSVMEAQLIETPYLTGEKLTTADIALYGYTHVAHEGGFELSKYPAIQSWLRRIASHPKYVGMNYTAYNMPAS